MSRLYSWEHQPHTAVLNVPSKLPMLKVLSTKKKWTQLPRLAVMKARNKPANACRSIDTFQTDHAQLPTLAVL